MGKAVPAHLPSFPGISDRRKTVLYAKEFEEVMRWVTIGRRLIWKKEHGKQICLLF